MFISHNIYKLIIDNLNFTDTNNFSQCCRKLWRFYLLFRPYEKYRGSLRGCVIYNRLDIFKLFEDTNHIDAICEYNRDEMIKIVINKMDIFREICLSGNMEMAQCFLNKHYNGHFSNYLIRNLIGFHEFIETMASCNVRIRCNKFIRILSEICGHNNLLKLYNAMNDYKKFKELYKKIGRVAYGNILLLKACNRFDKNIIKFLIEEGCIKLFDFKIRSIKAVNFFMQNDCFGDNCKIGIFENIILPNNALVMQYTIKKFNIKVDNYVNKNNYYILEKYASNEKMLIIATELGNLKMMDKYLQRVIYNDKIIYELYHASRNSDNKDLHNLFDFYNIEKFLCNID